MEMTTMAAEELPPAPKTTMAAEELPPAPGYDEEPLEVLCMACSDPRCDFKPLRLRRRALGRRDVEIAMKYCGVCHSDLHATAGHTTESWF